MNHFSLSHFIQTNPSNKLTKLWAWAWAWAKQPKISARSRSNPDEETNSVTARVENYYAEVSDGYEDWSRELNMHFGNYEWGMNPFNLEAMLENTNRIVLNSLALRGRHNHILDMGCGLGATMRYAANQPSISAVTGVTIAANQVEEAETLSAECANKQKLNFLHADYHDTPFEKNSFDGAYAIESSCHSQETNKGQLVTEAFRVLKPGATFTICDGFVKNQKPT